MITLSHDLNFTYEFKPKQTPLFKTINSLPNFRCNIYQVDGYGYLVNNIWDGGMALHAQNNTDLLLHGTSMRADRMAVIEYTTGILRVELKKACSSMFQISQTENFKFLIFKYTNILRQPSLTSNSNVFLPLHKDFFYLFIRIFGVCTLRY